MLSDAIELQKITTSIAPASAMSRLVGHANPLKSAPVRFPRMAGTTPQAGPSQTAHRRPSTSGGKKVQPTVTVTTPVRTATALTSSQRTAIRRVPGFAPTWRRRPSGHHVGPR